MSATDHGLRPEVIIIGAGIGGLATALALRPMRVSVLDAGRLEAAAHETTAASRLAQGGIAAALGPGDHPESHAEDTVRAAGGLAEREIVELVTRAAPESIARLVAFGAIFTRDADGAFRLGHEGGHSHPRIVHANDETGREMMRVLIQAVRQAGSITVLEQVVVEEILVADGRIAGVVARRGQDLLALHAPAVVMATGGIGGLFRHTTNPLSALGRGLALAARAGAALVDLEFVQFHPTALAAAPERRHGPMPLLTEALRGRGAHLVNEAGRRFLLGCHPLAELAPRDIVARAVWGEITAGRQVFLDARHAIGSRLPQDFPAAWRICRAVGIDPTQDPIPVAPAAHYHMGGIAIDAEGKSSLPGLWAVGEVAASGLHGANRLASNSLLEALVFAPRLAASIQACPGTRARAPADISSSRRPAPGGSDDRAALWRLREIMSARVGIVRDAAGLGSAIRLIRDLRRRAEFGPPALADAALLGELIATAALARRESRGSHYRSDWPEPGPGARHSRLTLADLPLAEEACP